MDEKAPELSLHGTEATERLRRLRSSVARGAQEGSR